MDFARYKALLRRRDLTLLLLVGMVARFPHSAAGVLLTLHVVLTLGRDWTSAGTVAAVMTVGIALGAPWRGRQVDAHGLRRALIPSVVAEIIVWSAIPHLPYEWLLPVVFVGGVFTLPVFSVLRQSLGVMTDGEERRSAFALDSIVTELIFMTGPALGAVVATQVSTAVGLTAVGVAASGAGLLLMLQNPPTRSDQPGAVSRPDAEEKRREAVLQVVSAAPAHLAEVEGELVDAGGSAVRRRIRRRGRRLRSRFGWVTGAIVAVFATAAGAGLLLAGTDVGIVAVLEDAGNVSELGWVFLAWCGASLVGGLLYGASRRKPSPVTLLLAMSVLTVPAMFATNTLTLALLCIPSGLLCAPTLAAASERVTELVDERRRGEAMGWYGSSMTAGTALGAPVVGVVIDARGASAGFLAAGLLGVLVCLAAIAAQAARRRQPARQAAAAE